MDEIPVYKKGLKNEIEFSGKRIKRGLYKSKNGILINADINGSLNILRKNNDKLFTGESVMALGIKPVTKVIISNNLLSQKLSS